MRKREPKLVPNPSGLPPKLAAGPCIEVWVNPDERPPDYWEKGLGHWQAIQAHTRYTDASRRWAKQHNLTYQQMRELAPGPIPYSASYLCENGRESDARRRLGPLADSILGRGRSRG